MVTGMQVAEVVEVIKNSPEQFLATVRPIRALTKGQKADTSNVTYSEIVPMATNSAPPRNEGRKISPLAEQKHLLRLTPQSSPTPSLEDVGNYDDEDEGDIPPPLPPRTEDALILVDSLPKQGNGEEGGGGEGGGGGGEGEEEREEEEEEEGEEEERKRGRRRKRRRRRRYEMECFHVCWNVCYPS